MPQTNEQRKRLKDRRRKKGLCTNCGDILKSDDQRRCYDCRKVRQVWKKSRKNKGLCISCGKKISKYIRCKFCLFLASLYKIGLSLEERLEVKNLFEKFKNKCECCGSSNPRGKNWNLDHDHRTGKFRGFICMLCNTMLGMSRDSEKILMQGIEYLRRANEHRTSNDD